MQAPRRDGWLTAAQARLVVRQLAQQQEQVVGRRQLVQHRVPRWYVRAQLRAGRWQKAGRQTVVSHNGPLPTAARRWIAVLETCPRAALDGVAALLAAGAKGLDDEPLDVIAPKGSKPQRSGDTVVHESRRFRESDVVSVGIRRMRPAVACVHAALWARSDRQAQLFVLVCVQQRLASVSDIADVVETILRHPRRRLLRQLVLDLAGGVESLGELDVAGDLRRRGLPEPDRQVVRRRPSGTQYLDCDFPGYSLTLEIDGAGHDAPEQRLTDLLRDIEVATDGQTVVRIPLTAYRLGREQVLDRLTALFRARGWAALDDAA